MVCAAEGHEDAAALGPLDGSPAHDSDVRGRTLEQGHEVADQGRRPDLRWRGHEDELHVVRGGEAHDVARLVCRRERRDSRPQVERFAPRVQ